LGNLIQVLSADCFARFCRLKGYETLYVCGTDEYGTATETRADEEGISPRELCDRYFAVHAEIYRWFHIGFDKFGRTSTPIQTEIVQDIFKKLDGQGFITEKTIEQLYCASCGRFLADRYVRGTCPHCGYADARGDQCESCGKLLDPTELTEPRCSSCASKPALQETKHLYINLPAIKDRLEPWIKDASLKGRWANNAVQMTQAWIRDGLRERAITRDLKWGIPVPKAGYENKVFYVWFDAPIGYISISGNLGAESSGDWRKFVEHWWKSPDDVELFQFIGKDNIPFHTVIFPSSLLGTGEKWTMLHHMSSTEYLNYESGKFSKTRGIGVFGNDVMETGIPSDVWRFYIFYNRPERSDALFTWKDFQEKVNGELIGNLGNLVNRTLSFVSRYYDGKIPSIHARHRNQAFWETLEKHERSIAEKLDWAELRDAFREIFELSSFANKTFQDGEPWKKRTEEPEKAETLIAELCYALRDIAVMIEPYMPQAAARIASFFGLSIGPRALTWDDLGKSKGLHKVVKSEVLFAKLEDDRINELREQYSGTQKERSERAASDNVKAPAGAAEQNAPKAAKQNNAPRETAKQNSAARAEKSAAPLSPEEAVERFSAALDLRVAEIVKVEKHPNAEKLYIETLDIAGEERVIVSGLVPHYKEEELLHKHIIVAYNLRPAKLRGVMSQGMLLAAEDHNGPSGAERCEVLDVAGIPTGTRVVLEGTSPGAPPSEITVDTFFSVPLRTVNGIVSVAGRALTLEGKPVRTSVITDGEIH
jgi:methionyl-tRNA synthetase